MKLCMLGLKTSSFVFECDRKVSSCTKGMGKKYKSSPLLGIFFFVRFVFVTLFFNINCRLLCFYHFALLSKNLITSMTVTQIFSNLPSYQCNPKIFSNQSKKYRAHWNMNYMQEITFCFTSTTPLKYN